jgi:hypothetical protein
MIRAGDVLLLGGMATLTNEENEPEAFARFEGRRKGLLWFISARDGTKVRTFNLEAPPVWDGMAVANKRLYISRTDGVIECLSGK